MSFEETYDKVTKMFEGGYADDPADSGGETIFGVSRANFPNWPQWPRVDEFKKGLGKLSRKERADAITDRFKLDPEMRTAVKALFYEHFYKPFELRQE
jgi:lysozyme family protein